MTDPTPLYIKQGRRYIPWGNAEDWHAADVMRAGEFRLVYCAGNGETRYASPVDPIAAPFLAAAEIAQAAMEKAISDRAAATLERGRPALTKKQQHAMDGAQQLLRDAGTLQPPWWRSSSAREIAAAGIAAVQAAYEQGEGQRCALTPSPPPPAHPPAPPAPPAAHQPAPPAVPPGSPG